MKKTFPLTEPGKTAPRVVDAVKADIRRYVKRERRKPLPDGADLWEVACAIGPDPSSAQPKALAEVSKAIDEIVATGAESVYVEIQARPAQHPPRKPRSDKASDDSR